MVLGGHMVQNNQNQSNKMVLGGHLDTWCHRTFLIHQFGCEWAANQKLWHRMKVFSVFHKLLLTKTLSTISHSFEYYYLQYLCIQNAISDQINKKFEKGWTQLWINIKRVLFVWICFSFPTNLSLTLLIPGIRLLLSCL